MQVWDTLTTSALAWTAIVTPFEVALLEPPIGWDTAVADPLFLINRFIDLIFVYCLRVSNAYSLPCESAVCSLTDHAFDPRNGSLSTCFCNSRSWFNRFPIARVSSGSMVRLATEPGRLTAPHRCAQAPSRFDLSFARAQANRKNVLAGMVHARSDLADPIDIRHRSARGQLQ